MIRVGIMFRAIGLGLGIMIKIRIAVGIKMIGYSKRILICLNRGL